MRERNPAHLQNDFPLVPRFVVRSMNPATGGEYHGRYSRGDAPPQPVFVGEEERKYGKRGSMRLCFSIPSYIEARPCDYIKRPLLLYIGTTSRAGVAYHVLLPTHMSFSRRTRYFVCVTTHASVVPRDIFIYLATSSDADSRPPRQVIIITSVVSTFASYDVARALSYFRNGERFAFIEALAGCVSISESCTNIPRRGRNSMAEGIKAK